MKYKHIDILSAGHLATDINQGALPDPAAERIDPASSEKSDIK